jgi:hypothetical protein
MTLHLHSIQRADARPSEAAEIALRIERGDLSFHDLSNSSLDTRKPFTARRLANARERDVIVRALRAYG